MRSFNLWILDGADSIGGNKIALTSEGEGLFLDFGVNMRKKRAYEVSYRVLAIANKMFYHLYSEILPRIRGIYRSDLIELDERVKEMLANQPELSIQAALISHAHIDHYGAIGFLSNEITVAVSNSMKTMIEAMAESSSYDIEGEIFRLRDRREERREEARRTCEIFEEGKHVSNIPFNVKTYPVDHSVPAAFGFLIEDASLAYTGDIRIHGPRRDLTEKFLEKIRGVDYLLIEGTRIDTSTNISEENVFKRIEEYVAEKPDKFACIIVSSTDLDRVRSIFEIAERLGRVPILSPRLIYLIDKLMETESKIALPSLKNACIYFERRSLYGGGYDLSPRHYRRWMREVYESRLDGKKDGELKKAEEVSKGQDKYILIANNLDYVLEIAQIRPEPGSRLIVSTSEPHDEEQEISWGKFLEWVDLLRLDLRIAHSSGHADRESILRMIEEVDPKVIIPIHTERPYEFQRLKRLGYIKCNVILPNINGSLSWDRAHGNLNKLDH
ncbi:MAG: hypothetical protein DRN47_04190 [Candidatus Wolframiiraptor sp.]|nr:MAG: hypothetical protein DRN47_04190 [Candidatus Wolframiiraptor sp.]